MKHVIPIVAGVLFGLGLDLSQMTDPDRVLGFLDVTGVWDPTLVFVLAGAFVTSAIGFRTLLRGNQSWFAGECSLPANRIIDARLIGGAAVFGTGWGIAGYCPGPGLAALTHGAADPAWFVIGMVGGMIAYAQARKRTAL